MATLTVTAKGQVTLRKDFLRHLGVEPGQQLEISALPGGRVEVKAARPSGTFSAFAGLLAGKTSKVATLDDINEAAASAWTGQE